MRDTYVWESREFSEVWDGTEELETEAWEDDQQTDGEQYQTADLLTRSEYLQQTMDS